ncbi:DUF669 domain-containing protein [Methylomicrobium agile]|uniref:DUF669 domain-containing protein n=1 Tax=Methylomicrobium agile TaxID=39774 RepID=UPI0004DFA12A|nr:DUF669 domain-containing protein [Methylomicrobium agile]
MAQLGFVFDANQVEPDAPLEAVPTGRYPVMMVESEYKQNSKKTGTLVSIKLEIIDGQYKGRRIFGNINMTNPNPEAERIGRSQFSALCRATGQMQVSDTSALHHIPMCVSVEYVDPRNENGKQYPASNDIKGYLHISEYTKPTASPTSAPAAAPAYTPHPHAPAAPVYNAPPTAAPAYSAPPPAAAPVYQGQAQGVAQHQAQPAPPAAPVYQAQPAPAAAPVNNQSPPVGPAPWQMPPAATH